MPTIVIPVGYTFVLASIASTAWLNIWQYVRVSAARKAAGIKYPQLYADSAEAAASPIKMKFNCVQRAHQNTLEILPFVVFSSLLSGLEYPKVSAGLTAAWVLGRVLYTIGYSTGDPSKRGKNGGSIGSIANVVLMALSTYTAYTLVRREL